MKNNLNQEIKLGDIILYFPCSARAATLGVFRGNSTPTRIDGTDDNLYRISVRTMMVFRYIPTTYDRISCKYTYFPELAEVKVRKDYFTGGNMTLKLDDYMLYNLYDRKLANKAKETQIEVIAGKYK